MLIAFVIVDVPARALNHAFSYRVPGELAGVQVGCAVSVDFGNRPVVGFVVGLEELTEASYELRCGTGSTAKLKSLLGVLSEPYFDEVAAQLASWIAHEYLCPLPDAFRLFTPPGGSPKIKRIDGRWQLMFPGVGEVDDRWVFLGPTSSQFTPRKNAVKQQQVLSALSCGGMRVAELALELGAVNATLKALEAKDVVRIEHRRRLRDPLARIEVSPAPKHTLTTEQEHALSTICDACAGSVVLVDGITGSGKTEVYLQAIERCLEGGRQAIVLVPEISLTPQTVGRFRARFPENVAVLHSRLSAGERFDQWSLVAAGQADVVVGTRSALFAPLTNVGLVVIDEEHDGSYKQDNAPRYHARTVAAKLAELRGAVLVLGSATPSLETLVACEGAPAAPRRSPAKGGAAFGRTDEGSLTTASASPSPVRDDGARHPEQREGGVAAAACGGPLTTASPTASPVRDDESQVCHPEQRKSEVAAAACGGPLTTASPTASPVRDDESQVCHPEQRSVVFPSASSKDPSQNASRSDAHPWQRVVLTQRATGAALPKVSVVDMAAEFKGGSRSMFSKRLTEALAEVYEAGEKAVLMLNKRGFASFVLCRECGFVPECPSCSVSLTFHERGNRLVCHHCDHSEPLPARCPKCGSPYLRKFGAGTERVEAELRGILPADMPIVRMDADTVKGKGGHEKLLAEFAQLERGVLLGTQMIAKGLDFPEVTLVGVINADTTLKLPDYRAPERTYQLLEQVAGRAGRAEKPGQVIVQTYWPEHPAILAAARHDRQLFLDEELPLRRNLGYPPYTRLANVLVWGKNETNVQACATQLALAIAGAVESAEATWTLLGPAPCVFAKLKGVHRWHILIKAEPGTDIAGLLEPILQKRKRKHDDDTRVAVDVDPDDLL